MSKCGGDAVKGTRIYRRSHQSDVVVAVQSVPMLCERKRFASHDWSELET